MSFRSFVDSAFSKLGNSIKPILSFGTGIIAGEIKEIATEHEQRVFGQLGADFQNLPPSTQQAAAKAIGATLLQNPLVWIGAGLVLFLILRK